MPPIAVSVPGAVLAADLYPAPEPRGAFAVTHGWGSSRPSDIPAALAAAGFTTLAYDLRGHGQSDGELGAISRADWVDDLVTVLDHLRGQVGPATPMGLVGASFGAYLSVLASRQRPVHCLSLRVPANYPDDGFAEPHLARAAGTTDQQWRTQPCTPAENTALAALHAFGGAVQLVDADSDTVIAPQTVANFAAAVRDPDRLSRATLREAPHHLADARLRADYIALLVGWAARVLPASE